MMDESEFDKFADEYYDLHKQNLGASGESPEFFAEYKIKDVFNLINSQSIKVNNILDFGAGTGSSVPYFQKYFPNVSLTCLDVSKKSLEVGKNRYCKYAHFQSFNGEVIPFSDNTYDLVFAACVFHHIPHNEHITLMQEWFRVLKPGGVAIIYEHNPLNPLTVHAVNTCPFDKNARLITGSNLRNRLHTAGFPNVKLRYRVFMPRILRAFRSIERWLYRVPLGAQYYIYGIK